MSTDNTKQPMSQEIREQIDIILHKMAVIECNLGTDVSKKELVRAKQEQAVLLEQIKKLDQEFYDSIVPY